MITLASIGAIASSSGGVDPLAGIVFGLRLQSHALGSNVPLGLFKDVACTIPALEDGDQIAAWRDESNSVLATQPDPQYQPLLVFEGGVPTVMFDGVDDFFDVDLSIADSGIVGSSGLIVAGIRSDATTPYMTAAFFRPPSRGLSLGDDGLTWGYNWSDDPAQYTWVGGPVVQDGVWDAISVAAAPTEAVMTGNAGSGTNSVANNFSPHTTPLMIAGDNAVPGRAWNGALTSLYMTSDTAAAALIRSVADQLNP